MDSVLNVDTAPTNHQPAGRGGKEGEGARGGQAACAACSPQLEAHGCEFAVGAHVLPGGWGRGEQVITCHTILNCTGNLEWAGQSHGGGRDKVREW